MKKFLSFISTLVPIMALAQGGNPDFQSGQVATFGEYVVFFIIIIIIISINTIDRTKQQR
jgi:hypothetical protein